MPKTATLSFRICFALFTFLLLNYSVFGQCPVPNSCTPGNAPVSAFQFDMGIFGVTVGSGPTGINNPSPAGNWMGYQDYSCSLKVTVMEGVAVPISVTTNPNANENVRVWLDLNNDGIFDNSTELVFASLNAKFHTGAFTVPVQSWVAKNTVLRLRVAADNFASPLPTPCFTPQYSRAEDYGLIVLPNPHKPAIDFAVNNPLICMPAVQFRNLTQNGATSWLWDFGDGNTSISANPNHTYAAAGTYTVKLTACNANGCDSLTKTNYITYTDLSPTALSCIPVTQNYCCNYGITHVNFGNGIMTNASANASVGYEDFTCAKSFTVSAGKTYPVTLTTGNLLQDTKIYIDLNNDGDFTDPNEKLLELFSQLNPTAQVTIPATTFLNTPLRMRIISDVPGSNFNSCSGILSGQAEDYTIRITEPPFPAFSHTILTTCDGLVTFTDRSARNPTSWHWNFGDTASGATNVSTLQNPTHVFSNPGTYTVTLKSCNAQGCDSVSTTLQVPLNPVINLPTACVPVINSNFQTQGITGVRLGGINQSIHTPTYTYFNYACTHFTSLVWGDRHHVEVNTEPTTMLHVQIWIDLNNDGDLNAWERVFASTGYTNHSGVLTFPTNYIPVKNTYLRMRVRTHAEGQNNTISACTPMNLGKTEDYAVMFIDSTSGPTGIIETDFSNAVSLFPNPNNGTFSLQIPSVLKGDFQLEVQNMIGQKVATKTLKPTGENHQIDLRYLPKGVYLVRVFNTEFSTIKKLIIE